MRYTTTPEQRDSYRKEGWVRFEGFLKPDQQKMLREAAEKVVKQRNPSPELLPKEQFEAARDMWRDEDRIRRFLSHPSLIAVIDEIVAVKPLRLAFDQLVPEGYIGFDKPIDEMSAINHLHMVIALPLEKVDELILMNPHTSLNFLNPTVSYLIAAYGDLRSQYLRVDADPHLHTLKKLGYAYGDLLKDHLHPLFR